MLLGSSCGDQSLPFAELGFLVLMGRKGMGRTWSYIPRVACKAVKTVPAIAESTMSPLIRPCSKSLWKLSEKGATKKEGQVTGGPRAQHERKTEDSQSHRETRAARAQWTAAQTGPASRLGRAAHRQESREEPEGSKHIWSMEKPVGGNSAC